MFKLSLTCLLILLLSGCQTTSTPSPSSSSDINSLPSVIDRTDSNPSLETSLQPLTKKKDTDRKALSDANPFAKYPVSLYNLSKLPIEASALALGKIEYTTAKYTRYRATYSVNGIKNSAIINIPFSATENSPAQS